MAKKKNSVMNMFFVKGGMDIPFFMLLITIVTIGLVMLFSASYTYSYYNRGGDSLYIFRNQLIFTCLGLAAMYVVSRIRYEYFRALSIIAAGISLILLVIVLFLPDSVQPGFYRWINLGFMTFQPSEIAKVSLIMALAYLLEKDYKVITGKVPTEIKFLKQLSDMTGGKITIYKSFTKTVAYGLLIVIFAGLVYMENHLSGAVLMFAIGIIMLFLGEVRYKWFVLGGTAIALVGLLIILKPELLEDYMGERITAWLDKDYDPLGKRWQTNNSLFAIGSGGLLGAGLGQSKQKHLYVSEPQNDFIFSIVCEELGFVGATIIIILFALLVYRGIYIGLRAKDRFSGLLAMGISFQIGVQVALNIAVVSDFIPNTGISLPFFSSGGTSIFILLCEMGMLLSVSRTMRRKG